MPDEEQTLFNAFMDTLGETLTPEQERRLNEEVRTRSYAAKFAERKKKKGLTLRTLEHELLDKHHPDWYDDTERF